MLIAYSTIIIPYYPAYKATNLYGHGLLYPDIKAMALYANKIFIVKRVKRL